MYFNLIVTIDTIVVVKKQGEGDMSLTTKIGFLQFGLGPIGLEIVKNMMNVHQLDVLGAVDIDPEKVGKDLGELLGTEEKGVQVVSSLDDVQVTEDYDKKVAIHATGSNLENVWPQIKELLDHGFSVVSTCEQLSYPWHRYPELAKEIDDYAKNKGLTVIGTGINPGFVMDTLAVVLSSVTNQFEDIKVLRKVDVSKRRLPLQKKVGVGMTVDEFNALAKENRIGHVGLEESARLLAYGLGLELAEVKNSIKPVIADKAYQVAAGDLAAGQVAGQHQFVEAKTVDGKNIVLELMMAVSVDQEDRITFEGPEPIEIVVPNGIFGDTATAAMVINTAKLIGTDAAFGLLTMVDIRLPRHLHGIGRSAVPTK